MLMAVPQPAGMMLVSDVMLLGYPAVLLLLDQDQVPPPVPACHWV